MGEYLQPAYRFSNRGMNLRAPADAMLPGKYPLAVNVRAYLDHATVARPGLVRVSDQLPENTLHTVYRLNDPSQFAGADSYLRVVGAGTKVFGGQTGAFTELASGFSGKTLGFVAVLPDGQTQPWCYIVDTEKMVKTRVDKTVYGIGLPAPVEPPTAALDAPSIKTLDFITAGWSAVGAYAGAPAGGDRFNTTIAKILYDTGNTGWSNQVFTDMDGVAAGAYVTWNSLEQAYIQSVKPKLADTTIGSIIYDAGVTGLCTIQPVASVSIGALDSPVAGSSQRRGSAPVLEGGAARRATNLVPHGLNLDSDERQRIVDMAVDAYVTVNGEGVRILSVTVGSDGIESFRCRTVGTAAAGQAIVGFASLRIFTVATWAVTDTVDNAFLENTITPPSPAPAAMFGGITKVLALDMSTINGRPTQPDDEIHLSFKLSSLQQASEIRLYFDVDAATNDFTKNYYFYAARPTDLAAALQETNAGNVTSVTSGRQTAVQRSQLNKTGAGAGVSPRTGRPIGDAGGGSGGQASPRTGRVNPTGVGGDDPLSGSIGTVRGGAVSGQFGGGVDQWVELRFRVSDLSRVGADQTRSLANVAAVQIVVSCSGSAPLQIWYNSLWLGGAHGPDVGTIGEPYLYCYRPWSTVTGARGNPSPAMRSGVSPRRQKVIVTGTQHPSPEVDRLEWFRYGGGLPGWRSAGFSNNDASPSFEDTYPDSVVVGNGGLERDNFQPWPVTDKPRTGTVNTAGTAINWVSGDKFNTSWAPGTPVVIGGQPYTLYKQPASDERMEVLENIGTLAGVDYAIQDATILGQPLPAFWGPSYGFYFACGDDRNPGLGYWTKGNNPEVTSDRNTLQVAPPDEPLMNGVVCDRRPFVFSNTDLYEFVPRPDNISDFDCVKTPCGRGLFARRGIATDGVRIFFVSENGIFVTEAGSVAQSITDEDLLPLFPHDGIDGVEVNGIQAPDMSRPDDMKLSFANGFLYFDYISTAAEQRTLVFDPRVGGWFPDLYAGGAASHVEENGDGVFTTLVGGTNGFLNVFGGVLDHLTPITCTLRTASETQGDPRLEKFIGDVMVDVDAQGGAGVTVTAGFNVFSETQAGVVVAPGVIGRSQTPVDIDLGQGRFARDIALQMDWSTAADINPVLYTWQPSFVPKASKTAKRPTDYDDCGYAGAKFVQGVIIRANTYDVPRQVQVVYDGGAIGPTLTINHNGDVEKPYPTDGSILWAPFMAHLVRLMPIDEEDWMFLGARWVFEKAPELATVWQTPPMTFGVSGFLTFRPYALIGYLSVATGALRIEVDGQAFTYVLPTTGGVYKKSLVPLAVMKGKAVTLKVSCTSGLRLYQQDLEFGIRQWGSSGPWSIVRPFGDVSAEGAARI